MALYLKRNGDWKLVDEPYIKRDGQWILPEEGYIKENGQWKLIFEQFDFDIETVSHGETQSEAILTGQLSGFGGSNSTTDFSEAPHFIKSLPEPATGSAVATSADLGKIVVGEAAGSAYVYDIDLSALIELTEPTNDVTSVSIREPDGDIAVADADGNVFIYDGNFGLKTNLTDQTAVPADVEYDPSGRLAVASTDGDAYIYDSSYGLENTLSYGPAARSASWRLSDGFLAVGGDDPAVKVYDASLTQVQSINQNHDTSTTSVAFGDQNGELAVLSENRVHVYNNNFTKTDNLDQGAGGPVGDLAWDGTGRLAHGSEDDFLYIFDTNKNLIKTFDDAGRSYVSIGWDTNQLLPTATLQSGAGAALVYSVAVSPFFQVVEQGTGFTGAVRRRTPGLLNTGQFSRGIRNLIVDTEYDFRAGAEAETGRKAFGDTLTFKTPNIVAVTTTLQSGDVGPLEAELQGQVTDFNRPLNLAETFFEWGPEQQSAPFDYPNEIKATDVNPEKPGDDGTFAELLTGLDIDTSYQFRSKARYGGVTVFGDRETFTTDELLIQLDTKQPQTFAKREAEFTGEVTNIISDNSQTVGLTFFEYREQGQSGFPNRVPTTGFFNVPKSATPANVTQLVTGLDSNTTYDYRFLTDSGFDGGIETFTTEAFDISFANTSFTLRPGSTRLPGQDFGDASPPSLTHGDAVEFSATVNESGGLQYQYAVREIINGTVRDTLTGTNTGGTLSLNWNVGFSSSESGFESTVSDGDNVEYEVFIQTTIQGASSNDTTAENGSYVTAPKIAAPSSATFNVTEGGSDTQSIDISEVTGLDTLSISNVNINGDNRYTINSSPSSVSPQGTEQVVVEYQSNAGDSGIGNADLEIDHDGVNDSGFTTVSLGGNFTVLTEVDLSPTSESFGTQFVRPVSDQTNFQGSSTSTRQFSVSEATGSGSYNITNVNVTGDYAIDSNTSVPTTVSGSGGTFNVKFDPNGNGTRTGNLELDNDADSGPNPLSASLSGNGEFRTDLSIAGDGGTGDPTVNINAVNDGSTESVTVTIEEEGGDNGTSNLSISESAVQPSGTDQSQWNVNNVPTGVSAGGTETFEVTFAPISNNDQDYKIDVVYDGTGISTTNRTLTISASVTGTASISVPNTVDFGNGGTQSITITNDGTLPITGINVSSNNGEFVVQGGTVPNGITTSEGSKTFDVDYQPNSINNDSGTITVSTNETANETISVTGDGQVPNPQLSVSPTSKDFGTDGGSQQFTISNTGNVDLTDVSTTITGTDSGDFSISGGLSGATINQGDSQTATVNYNPSSTSIDSAFLNVSDGNTSASVGANLDGDGITATIELAATDITITSSDLDPGGSFTYESTFQNTGNTAGSADPTADTASNGTVDQASNEVIPANSTKTITGLTGTVDSNVVDGDTLTLTLSLDGTNIATKTITAPIFGGTISLDKQDYLTTDSYTATATINNTGSDSESVNYDIVTGNNASGSQSGTVNVSANGSTQVTLNGNVTGPAGQQFGVGLDLDGTNVGNDVGNIVTVDIDVKNVNITSSGLQPGDSFNFDVTFENTGGADGTISPSQSATNGSLDSNISNVSVNANSTKTLSFSGTVDTQVQQSEDLTVTVGSVSDTVDIFVPSIIFSQVSDIIFGTTGESNTYEVENNGEVGFSNTVSSSFSGVNPGAFEIDGNDVSQSLGVGATDTISVKYTGSTDGQTATLNINTGTSASASLDLTGNGGSFTANPFSGSSQESEPPIQNNNADTEIINGTFSQGESYELELSYSLSLENPPSGSNVLNPGFASASVAIETLDSGGNVIQTYGGTNAFDSVSTAGGGANGTLVAIASNIANNVDDIRVKRTASASAGSTSSDSLDASATVNDTPQPQFRQI